MLLFKKSQASAPNSARAHSHQYVPVSPESFWTLRSKTVQESKGPVKGHENALMNPKNAVLVKILDELRSHRGVEPRTFGWTMHLVPNRSPQ